MPLEEAPEGGAGPGGSLPGRPELADYRKELDLAERLQRRIAREIR